MMPTDTADISTTEQLHCFVHEVLCEKENLLPGMFVTTTSSLLRAGKPCGVQFLLQGPRCVKLSAVWASDQNVVYFYDTRGQRYRKERLRNRLCNEPAAG